MQIGNVLFYLFKSAKIFIFRTLITVCLVEFPEKSHIMFMNTNNKFMIKNLKSIHISSMSFQFVRIPVFR